MENKEKTEIEALKEDNKEYIIYVRKLEKELEAEKKLNLKKYAVICLIMFLILYIKLSGGLN